MRTSLTAFATTTRNASLALVRRPLRGLRRDVVRIAFASPQIRIGRETTNDFFALYVRKSCVLARERGRRPSASEALRVVLGCEAAVVLFNSYSG